MPKSTTPQRTTFLWFELTGRCQLECVHCYADSSPRGTHGTMKEADWLRVLDQGVDNGLQMVQFIGGEPLTHPSLPALVNHGLSLGVRIEVFSNLFAVGSKHWELFRQPGVSLATSYYSANETEHELITATRQSYRKTRENIAKAVGFGIPLRVGIIEMMDGQQVRGAVEDLISLGVPANMIGTDHLRGVGRGIRNENASLDQLCGQCGVEKAVVMPDGNVYPCVFSRWMDPIGNVLKQSLQEVLFGQPLCDVRDVLNMHFYGLTTEQIHDTPQCCPGAEASRMDVCQPDYKCGPYERWPAMRHLDRGDQPVAAGLRADSYCQPDYCNPNVCRPRTCNPG